MHLGFPSGQCRIVSLTSLFLTDYPYSIYSKDSNHQSDFPQKSHVQGLCLLAAPMAREALKLMAVVCLSHQFPGSYNARFWDLQQDRAVVFPLIENSKKLLHIRDLKHFLNVCNFGKKVKPLFCQNLLILWLLCLVVIQRIDRETACEEETFQFSTYFPRNFTCIGKSMQWARCPIDDNTHKYFSNIFPRLHYQSKLQIKTEQTHL